MAKKVQKKTNKRVPSKPSEPRVKDFLDLIAPTAVKFNTDHYICGGTYRCTLALRSYPASTEELALLRRLGEKSGVTLHIYNRKVSVAEEDKIIHNAENKNKLDRGGEPAAHGGRRDGRPRFGGAHRLHAQEQRAPHPLRCVH